MRNKEAGASHDVSLSLILEAMAAQARDQEAREQAVAAEIQNTEPGQRSNGATRHMRTIDAAWKHVKEKDPETCLTRTALRRLVVSGKVPSTRIGKKYLVCLETLDDYLEGRLEDKHPEQGGRGTIRRLEAKL